MIFGRRLIPTNVAEMTWTLQPAWHTAMDPRTAPLARRKIYGRLSRRVGARQAPLSTRQTAIKLSRLRRVQLARVRPTGAHSLAFDRRHNYTAYSFYCHQSTATQSKGLNLHKLSRLMATMNVVWLHRPRVICFDKWPLYTRLYILLWLLSAK